MAAAKSVVVPLSPEETFALITEPDRLRRWKAVSARIDLRAGGEYRFTVTPGHIAAGLVKEVEPGKRLVLSWGWEGDSDLAPGASTVTITLEPTPGGTLVRLVHEGLTDEQAKSHGVGWEHYLERLKVAAETGDAGMDSWALAPSPLDRFGAAESALASCQVLLRQMRPDASAWKTPCADFDVAQLIDHLLGSLANLAIVAGGASLAVNGDAEQQLAQAGSLAIDAWRRRGLEGTVMMGTMPMPAPLAADILAIELLVHAWDLAQATGLELDASEELAAYVLELARELISPELRGNGRFADALATEEDVDSLTKLVAFTGRKA